MKTKEVVRYISMEEFAKKVGVKEETVKKRYQEIPGITKEGNTFKAHKVETGMSNGIYTEIISGIKPGTEVLTDFEIIGGQPQEDTEQASNPFMPRPRNNRKNNTNAPKK